jgi:hypothetical protein
MLRSRLAYGFEQLCSDPSSHVLPAYHSLCCPDLNPIEQAFAKKAMIATEDGSARGSSKKSK